MKHAMIFSLLAAALASPAASSDLQGPARFCGYSPIIDLAPGESVTILESGIHAGSFRWTGAFGTLDVNGIGWATPPAGEIEREQNGTRPARFTERFSVRGYVIAIWNGAQGVAYFSSMQPFTPEQRAAIDRVRLYQEGQTPEGCNLRTVFTWE